MIKNKRGQMEGIIALVILSITLFIIAPILLYTLNTMLTKFSTSLSPIDSTAADAVSYGNTKFTAMFDWVIIIVFIVNVLWLFISSFMIDIHPAFIILYIIGLMFLFMLAPSYMKGVDKLYSNPELSASISANLHQTLWLKDNFIFILVGIAVLTGIIIFAKIGFFGGGNNENRAYR